MMAMEDISETLAFNLTFTLLIALEDEYVYSS
jgi:hypothetical protein